MKHPLEDEVSDLIMGWLRLPCVVAPIKSDEGVETKQGEGATGQDTGTAWILAQKDRPEAPAQVRPLVVLDPEDREQVERLMAGYFDHNRGIPADAPIRTTGVDYMQAALREFANPTPPKPTDPMGLGAVVEDEEGWKWLCNRFDPTIPWSKPWFSSDLDEWREYADINAVRILSEGVQP